jgi:hypothetical protein
MLLLCSKKLIPVNTILCEISGFQSGDYEEYRLLGCGAVSLLCKTDVSEELIASFFRIEKSASKEPA